MSQSFFEASNPYLNVLDGSIEYGIAPAAELSISRSIQPIVGSNFGISDVELSAVTARETRFSVQSKYERLNNMFDSQLKERLKIDSLSGAYTIKTNILKENFAK